MKLFIREATPSDWLPVRDLMMEIHDKAPYKDIPVSEIDMKRMFVVAAKSENHLTLVVTDKKHNVHGVIVAQVAPNWWGARVATELITYCNQPGWQHKLLKRYKKWAEGRKAQVITVANSSGENPRYERLVKALGFNMAGGIAMSFPQH